MKTKILMIFAVLLLAGSTTVKADPPGGVSFGVFYSSLSGYGEWIDCNLGYVWRPANVTPGWRPYLFGRWVWSDYGWYWVSAEPFGWATFHYGRWYYDDYYGWLWVPDQVWGPSWVEWRYDDDYIGWAPLAPYATFSVDVGISYRNPWVAPSHYWSFVTYHNFSADRMADCVQPAERNARLFGMTRGVVDIRSADNRVVNRGVDLTTIERRGNIRVRTADVIERSTAGREQIVREGTRDRVEAFRPNLESRMRDQVSRPQDVSVSNRRIATDFEKSLREKHEERIRSIDREPSPRIVPPRDRQVAPDARRPGWRDQVPPARRPDERPIPGWRTEQGRPQDRQQSAPEKTWRFPQPERRTQEGRGQQVEKPQQKREMKPPPLFNREPPARQRAPIPHEQKKDNDGRGKRGGGRGW